ncbi:GM17588 [Drosophila sechellia]|uniref:GM17588 n=1 Tax=Drosophila sechellia TaxID=7238 RepID=B4IG71_DROSE|nr:GM17588 [Drosophila sechellia]
MLAVLGSRKVATVLFDGKRKMTIFEMEIEEEKDDTELSQDSFLEFVPKVIAKVAIMLVKRNRYENRTECRKNAPNV